MRILSKLTQTIAGALICVAMFAGEASALPHDAGKTPKVVLITFDGVRWREIFRGADPDLVNDEHYVNKDIASDVVAPAYLVKDGASALMPFFHSVIEKDGLLFGNRDKGECAKVANDLWFSYPGYNEFLSGHPDPTITSNNKVPNKNRTVLEYLQSLPAFKNLVAMVGTWDVFPYIVNKQRTDVSVNSGFDGTYPTDVKTAREGLKLLKNHLRFTYIAFGDTDEFAHAGDYAQYLMSLERGDEYVREVWEYLQSDPYYKDQTTLILLTDHGRGETPVDSWREHGSPRSYQLDPSEDAKYKETGAIGSDNVWFGVLGPAVDKAGLQAYGKGQCAHSEQVAASILKTLGVNWREFSPTEVRSEAAAPFAFIR